MHYAVDYADVGTTRVARWQEGEAPIGLTLKEDVDKQKFLEAITAGDSVWMELGGAGDVFALVAMRNGAAVHRIPPFHVKDEREARDWEKQEDHLLLAALAQENSDLFYLMREVDEDIVRLRVLIRARTVVQRTVRIPTQLRLNRVYRDMWLVETPAEALEPYLKRRIARNPIFTGAAAYEKELEAQIAKVLKHIPVYAEVFEPIRGCGPIIGGTIIARVMDIRRFETLAALTAYAGYHLVKVEGEVQVPRRRKGQRANWDQALKQAVWLFTDVTNRQPADTEWRAMLEERKDYEREQHPEPVEVDGKMLYTKGHIHNRALRWLGQQFLEHVWREWRRFEGLPISA